MGKPWRAHIAAKIDTGLNQVKARKKVKPSAQAIKPPKQAKIIDFTGEASKLKLLKIEPIPENSHHSS